MKLARVLAWFCVALSLAGPFVATPARAQISETERKAAARAAYQEGVQLQDQGRYAEALSRFEAAQKLFDAPTHLLHIAETQALTGKLVESSETYETLIRRQLPPGSPEAFVQAQQQAQAEVGAVRQRIPTLRVTVRPDPQQLQNLQVTLNGAQMPNELLGIARPINPGSYKLAAAADGYATRAPLDIEIKEKEAKAFELILERTAGPAVVPAPVPPPYTDGQQPVGAPTPAEAPKPPPAREGVSSTGLLVGGRVGATVPGGSVEQDRNFDTFASAGPAFGVDVYARLAKVLLLGGVLDIGSLGAPEQLPAVAAGQRADVTTLSTYLGLSLGILPNVDRVSFIGDIGIGLRTLTRSVESGTVSVEESLSGLEYGLGAGLSIPAGRVRIVPKTGLNFGRFASRDVTCSGSALATTAACTSGTIADAAGHTFFFVGVGLYYSADLGKK